MDGAWILVEEVCYLDELREVAVEAVTKFFSRDKMKHVGHVGEYYCSGRNAVICEDDTEEELKVCIYGWVVKAN